MHDLCIIYAFIQILYLGKTPSEPPFPREKNNHKTAIPTPVTAWANGASKPAPLFLLPVILNP